MYNEKQQYKMAICAINFSGTVYCGIGGLLCAEYPSTIPTIVAHSSAPMSEIQNITVNGFKIITYTSTSTYADYYSFSFIAIVN